MSKDRVYRGAGESALINMDKLQNLRDKKLKPCFTNKNGEEYVIAMDVARSQSKNNNQSAFVVGRLNRGKTGNVTSVEIVNIITPENGLNFREQTIILKKLQKQYNAKMCVVDINGVGRAIPDEVIHETYDPNTNETFEAWNIVNMDIKSDVPNSPTRLFGINATGINNEIIVNFWDYIEGGKVKFLMSERNAEISEKLPDEEKIALMTAYMQTDKLMEELSNLKAEKTSSGKYMVKQVTKKIDKDRYSALVYLLYYVQNYENIKKQNSNLLECLFYN